MERKICYRKTTDLLLRVFRELRGETSFIRNYDISDRKNRILINEYGSEFSRENILFCDKFLIFAPGFVVTPEHFHSYSFDENVVKNRIISFKDIKTIRYNLMPCRTTIEIAFDNNPPKEVYNGVPNAETYSDIKAYESAVANGDYKARTICYLATIYALTALYNASEEYEKVYAEIEKNILQLIEYQKDVKNVHRKYGKFFSFDFVTCDYDPKEVEEALVNITSVKEEVKAEESQERQERFMQTLEKRFDDAREQYERQQRK